MQRHIVVPLDGSALAERALPIALDIARRGKGHVHLVRAHVPVALLAATPEGAIGGEMVLADKILREQARTYLTGVAERAAKEWGVPVDSRVDDGSPASVVLDAVDGYDAWLTVMTTHGAGGFAPGWLGSVADAVIRHSRNAVLALPENEAHQGIPFAPRRIMVALDGSALSEAILPTAKQLALLFGAQMDFVRVVAPYIPNDVFSAMTTDGPDPLGIDAEAGAAKSALDRVKAAMEQAGLVAHATVHVHPWPMKKLVEHVQETDPDCIALATQGRGVSRLLVGSVADKLLRTSRRPVLVLRPAKVA